MLSVAKRVEACYFPEIAKVVAIQYGINLAIETGLLPAMVESDSLSIINLILFRLPIRSKVGLIIEDIFDLQGLFDFANFVFSPMSYNMVTHNLAKMALAHAINLVLLKEVFLGLRMLVQEESILT
ncbi:hypothetical protein ACOSQ4_024091 [Xanthoceras sorbifolium]